MTASMSVLDLLSEGIKIAFPDGYSLIGDPAGRYIRLHHETKGFLGNRNLDDEGLDYALRDIEKMRRNS